MRPLPEDSQRLLTLVDNDTELHKFRMVTPVLGNIVQKCEGIILNNLVDVVDMYAVWCRKGLSVVVDASLSGEIHTQFQHDLCQGANMCTQLFSNASSDSLIMAH